MRAKIVILILLSAITLETASAISCYSCIDVKLANSTTLKQNFIPTQFCNPSDLSKSHLRQCTNAREVCLQYQGTLTIDVPEPITGQFNVTVGVRDCGMATLCGVLGTANCKSCKDKDYCNGPTPTGSCEQTNTCPPDDGNGNGNGNGNNTDTGDNGAMSLTSMGIFVLFGIIMSIRML